MLSFTKMNGAGNDFVMLDNRAGRIALDGAAIQRLCDRHRGVGADGVLLVEPAEGSADFRFRYYNADGGEADMCGNGARCFARFAARLVGGRDRMTFETAAGVIGAELLGDEVRIAMSAPHGLALEEELEVEGGLLTVHSINTGVPHAVVLAGDLAAVDLPKLGPALRYHPRFAPKGTNVNFVAVEGEGRIAVRTYERGVEGETLACGTGVTAAALIHHALTGTPSPIAVRVKGGETLTVGFAGGRDGFRGVTLAGPADFVFDGTIEA
jgi:diaminopimelate epimerase